MEQSDINKSSIINRQSSINRGGFNWPNSFLKSLLFAVRGEDTLPLIWLEFPDYNTRLK
jgi:hypothetical protein